MKSLLTSRKFHTWLGILVSAFILLLLLRMIDWVRVLEELKRVDYWIFIPATLITLLHFFVRSLRWRYLLPKGEKLPLSLLFDAFMIGSLATYLLPLRAGEFIRPYILKRKAEYSFSTAFSSIVIERFFDLSLVLLSFALMVMFVPGVPNLVYQGAAAFGVIAGAILLFMVAGGIFPDHVSSLSKLFLRPLPEGLQFRIGRFIDDFLAGTTVLHDPFRISAVVILSFVVWGIIYFFYQTLLLLFGISGSYWIGTAVGVFTALAVAAPSAPGFIGVYQAGCIAALVLFGINREVAAAYSIVTWVFQFLLTLLLGGFCLVRNNLRFADLRRRPEEGSE